MLSSLGALFEKRGFKAVPSPRQPAPGKDDYFRSAILSLFIFPQNVYFMELLSDISIIYILQLLSSYTKKCNQNLSELEKSPQSATARWKMSSHIKAKIFKGKEGPVAKWSVRFQYLVFFGITYSYAIFYFNVLLRDIFSKI